MAKKTFFLLLIITLLVWALPAGAETLELKCDYETGCDLCDAIALITQISRFILSITGSLALLFFVIGGLLLLISQGGSEIVNQGKKMLLGATFGVIIVFTGWGIVNLVIAGLTGQLGEEVKVAQLFSKPWNEIECVKPPKPKPPAAGGAAAEQAAGYCAGVAMSSGAGNTCSDASSSLITLLNCIKSNNALIITSISSSQYGLGPGCEITHSVNSCHCQSGGSKAVDFRSNMDWTTFTNLVGTCGKPLDESDKKGEPHYHVSTWDCPGV